MKRLLLFVLFALVFALCLWRCVTNIPGEKPWITAIAAFVLIIQTGFFVFYLLTWSAGWLQVKAASRPAASNNPLLAELMRYVLIGLIIAGVIVGCIGGDETKIVPEALRLNLEYSLVGMLLGAVVLVLLFIALPAFFQTSDGAFIAVFCLFPGLPALSIGTARIVNQHHATRHAECQKIEVLSTYRYRAKYNYKQGVNVVFRGERNTYSLPADVVNVLSAGDSLVLCTKMGALGYAFIDSIQPLK